MRNRFDNLTSHGLLVPTLSVAVLIVAAALMVVQITLRPWATANASPETHLNYVELPDDYSRTEPTFLGDLSDGPLGWVPSEKTSGDESGLRSYAGYGCASCHGLQGTGDIVGPDLSEVSFSELGEALGEGPEGMPAYHTLEMSEQKVAGLFEFLTGKTAPTPITGPTPTPVPVSPTATPAATETPAPTPTVGPVPTTGPGTPTPSPTAVPTPTVTPEPTPSGPPTLTASTTDITVDGNVSDWAAIEPTTFDLKSIMPITGKNVPDLPPQEVSVRVSVSGDSVYVLLEVPDDFDFNPDDRKLSAKSAVMWRIDTDAAPAMGAEEEAQRRSLGVVDIWHWSLDCGPGQQAGGGVEPGGRAGGNDPPCNFDDEYAETPTDLEDDGSSDAENSLLGVWEHTARASGAGADGTWIFEMSRPLLNDDPQDAQFDSGAVMAMAIAYWDPDQTPNGWSDLGHFQSSWLGWIEVELP